MFLLDSLMISGIQWALKTVITTAEAEMNDDGALRDQLLAAEMRREMGEISEDEYGEIEADLLARIREIKQRREGQGALGFDAAQPLEAGEGHTFAIDAEMSGDFHEAVAPRSELVASEPVEPVALPPPNRSARSPRDRTVRKSRAPGTARTPRTKKR